MKRKFTWLINLATICLCVCAIAIGVYAATSATLTVSGSIGFTAHGVDMNVTAYMYGHATSEAGSPIAESDKVSLTGDTAMNLTESETLSFTEDGSAIYFSDMESTDENGKPNDIIVEVTLSATENQKFDVLVTPSGTSVDDSITITPSVAATVVKHTGETTETSKTIIFTLSLQANENGGYDDVADTNSVSLTIAIEKVSVKENVTVATFTQSEQEEITENVIGTYFTSEYKSYAENFPYYITLGKEGNTDLRWLVIGVDDGEGQLTSLTQEDINVLAAGYMFYDKDYYVLSENVLYTESTTDYGIYFQNNFSTTNYSNYYNAYGVNPNDYATSNVRAYLSGATVYRSATSSSDGMSYTPSGNKITFATTYTFTTDELNLIKARSVSDLYSDKCMSVKNALDTLVPTTGDIDELKQTADKFWLLSYTEIMAVFDNTSTSFSEYSSLKTFVQGTNYTSANWTTRSPGDGLGTYTYAINGSMLTRLGSVCESIELGGIRPAFKI